MGNKEEILSKLLVTDVGFSERTERCLRRVGENTTVKDIIQLIDNDKLKNVRYLGKVGQEEVFSKLESLGFELHIENRKNKTKFELKVINDLEKISCVHFEKGSESLDEIKTQIREYFLTNFNNEEADVEKDCIENEDDLNGRIRGINNCYEQEIESMKEIISSKQAEYEELKKMNELKKNSVREVTTSLMRKVNEELDKFHHQDFSNLENKADGHLNRKNSGRNMF